jgi:hypothetical protein
VGQLLNQLLLETPVSYRKEREGRKGTEPVHPLFALCVLCGLDRRSLGEQFGFTPNSNNRLYQLRAVMLSRSEASPWP